MFASFASFLPSSNPLAFSEQQPQPFKQDFRTDDKLANEVSLFQSYVFKLTTTESKFDHLSIHPSNIQVQLVPPNGSPSLSVLPTGGYEDSLHNSVVTDETVVLVASNSTTASTRPTILPLYNLQAHNVMTNVIVDVGTDPKIAKF